MEIKNYLKNFIVLYPDVNPTPKMHFLIHLPNQMKEFGPPRLAACHRMEAKNFESKEHNFKNFRNICKSVSYRQENKMVSKRFDYDWSVKENSLSKGTIVQGIKSSKNHDFCERYFFDLSTNDLKECDGILINGFNYKLGDFVIVKDTLDSYKEAIGLIKGILIANNFPIFELELYDIILFNKINNCLKVKSVLKKTFRYHNQLVHKQEINSIDLSNNEHMLQNRFFFNLIK